jgi:hypothetical protein
MQAHIGMDGLPEAGSPSRFPDRLRLPLAFDPDRLAEDLERLSATPWTRHFVRQNYDGDWSVIPLRSPAGARHPIQMIYSDPACRSFEDTALLDGCPYFREVLGAFACPLRAVRLMRLASGSVIKTHTDHELSFEEGMVRMHVPVATNDGVEFLLNGTPVVMEAGSCWYLRLSDPHSVSNGGSTGRVHLVVDAFVNDWVEAVFEAAVARERGEAGPGPERGLAPGSGIARPESA